MLLAIRILWGLLGFLVGVVIGAIVIDFAHYIVVEVFYGLYYEPFRRLPPAALIVGVSTAWFGFKNPPRSLGMSILTTRYGKLLIAASLVWSSIVLTLVFGLNALGRYWNSDNWQKFWVLWLAPPAIGLLSLLLFRWALKGSGNGPNDT